MQRGLLICVLTLGVGAAPAPAQQDSTARIAGTVRSSIDGLPVAGVTVTVRGVRMSGVSDTAGAFALGGVPPGRRTVRIVYHDSLSDDQDFTLQPGATLTLSVVLAVDSLELTPIVVEAKSVRAERSLAGFFDRKKRGLGEFYTLADLDRLSARSPQTLLTHAGVTMRCRLRRCVPLAFEEARLCVMSLFFNGMRVPSDYLEAVRVEDLAGVEVYLHAVDVPVRFRSGLGTVECGAVLMWTRY